MTWVVTYDSTLENVDIIVGMKVVIRADASSEIGAGHVMRQVALAEELLIRGAEVFLVGEVSGASWLQRKLTGLRGLHHLSWPTGNFDPGPLREIGANASVVDSYAISQSELVEWESQCPATFLFVDGPWQRLSGRSAVVPSISKDLSWTSELRTRFHTFHAGPEFLMMRGEIKRAKQDLFAKPPSKPQLLITFGGANLCRHTDVITSVVERFASTCRVVMMGFDGCAKTEASNFGASHGVIHVPRSSFVRHLIESTVVVSAAGTTAGELLFLGIPSIFIPVADNQRDNAYALQNIDPSLVLWPDSPNFEEELASTVSEALRQSYSQVRPSARLPLIDGLGAQRLASFIVGG